MGKKRIFGNDRALMFLCTAARKYWRYYSPAYQDIKKQCICNVCAKHATEVEVDHIEPVGPRPRTFAEFSPWLERLFYLPVQGLCLKHHKLKTKQERAKRCKKQINV